jgi:predicted NAD-dependent protein-ADP-ribosyltransferase YbiA (DUF1768 family)
MILLLFRIIVGASVPQTNDWDDVLLTDDDLNFLLSPSVDEITGGSQEFIHVGGQKFPIRPASQFRSWTTRIWSEGAAFLYRDLVADPSILIFSTHTMSKYKLLSNLVTTPFSFEGLSVQSVESLIFAHFARVQLRNDPLAKRLARMDGPSARQVGKHFRHKPLRCQVQAFVQSKLIQNPDIMRIAKSLLDSEKLLVCTDYLPYDYNGHDHRFGMIRHGKFLVGENLLGKIYHDLHREM